MYKNFRNISYLIINLTVLNIQFVLIASDNVERRFIEESIQTINEQIVATDENLMNLVLKQEQQIKEQAQRLNFFESEIIKNKIENLIKNLEGSDESSNKEFIDMLSAIGFDLKAFLEVLSKLNRADKNLTELELDAYLKNLQTNFKFYKDVELTKENVNFIKNNYRFILQSISDLNDLLQLMARQLPFSYRFQDEQNLLQDATLLINKIKSVDVKKLKYSKSQLRFMLTVATVATAAIPLAMPYWNNRQEYQERYKEYGGFRGLWNKASNMTIADYKDLLLNINTTFDISGKILLQLKSYGQSFFQNRMQELDKKLPKNVYIVPNVATSKL